MSYRVIKNGQPIGLTKSSTFNIIAGKYAEYQVVAVDAKGVSSFASELVSVIPATAQQIIEAETITGKSELPYQGFTGDGYVEVSKTTNTKLDIPVNIMKAGNYVIDMRYANGNGPINTDNKCDIRTLNLDDSFAGTIVLPQRGKGDWSNWGYSNGIKLKLSKGKHVVSPCFKDTNENININVNQAMIDHFRLISTGYN
ncbi:hypothetical protein ABID99_003700 [Mucilaginibacter sp. OAE612]|uniref:hypothetical protein n=1 Tax=Mucilaginibacter sp. OAE612 TaxID=3156444 RepID=UPI00359E8C4A